VHYLFDESGQLLGEYDGTGKAIQETVYLGDLPVAVLMPTATTQQTRTANIYYVYADHLQTPRVLTRSMDNKMVWRWDNADPFGVYQPDENPSRIGVFIYNPRFRGQVFDRETNNHYNYFRDYDPQTGRYVQSDPVGLDGGVNTYAYVGGDPIGFSDPLGLERITSQDKWQPPMNSKSAECPPEKCKHTVTLHTGGVCPPDDTMCPLAMNAAGIAPPYGYSTIKLDVVCLAKLGIGVKGTGAAAGTIAGKYVPGIAARGASAAGAPLLGAYAGAAGTTIAEISSGPIGIAASVLGAVSFLAKECECKDGK
jgi:RHS repeat-associated protein